MSRTRETLLNAATVFVALCTVALVGITVFRQFVAPSGRDVRGRQPPVMLEDWRNLAAVGHRLGPEDADVTVVVFSDFECPSCSTFATTTYPDFQARYPGRTTLVFRHWPLNSHRLAYPAARASECAAEQGRFTQFHDLLFARQRELGIKTFHEFAVEAAVPDLAAFDECYGNNGAVPSIERGIEEARRIGGTGTPTVIVNGWLLNGGVSPELLDSIAQPFLVPRNGGGAT